MVKIRQTRCMCALSQVICRRSTQTAQAPCSQPSSPVGQLAGRRPPPTAALASGPIGRRGQVAETPSFSFPLLPNHYSASVDPLRSNYPSVFWGWCTFWTTTFLYPHNFVRSLVQCLSGCVDW